MNINDFRRSMRELPEPPNDSKPPFWDYWRHDLYQRGLNEDPNGFLGWPCVYHTMLCNHWRDYVCKQYDEMPMRYRVNATLMDVPFYPLDLAPDSTSSLNFIHQLYHLYRLSQATGVKIHNIETIVEFGGGYGAMRLMAQRLGFRGTYYIYDYPEFLILQRFFLSRFDVDGTTRFCTEIAQLPIEADLLIACYSISEADMELRDKFLSRTAYGYVLILSSERFAGYDNKDYFSKTADKSGDDYKYSMQPVKLLPEGSFYMFGSRT